MTGWLETGWAGKRGTQLRTNPMEQRPGVEPAAEPGSRANLGGAVSAGAPFSPPSINVRDRNGRGLAATPGGDVQGSGRKDAVFRGSAVYTVAVLGPKRKSWGERSGRKPNAVPGPAPNRLVSTRNRCSPSSGFLTWPRAGESLLSTNLTGILSAAAPRVLKRNSSDCGHKNCVAHDQQRAYYCVRDATRR